MLMRLQRFMAQAGVAARRKAEELIVTGHVRVNGKIVTELGSKIDPQKDRVSVDGQQMAVEEPVYLLMNKPRGYVTTLSDPQERPTVMELLKRVGARVYPIGRLDFNTEGVLLFTNDGDLANGLMHPSRGVEKVYRVKLRGVATQAVVDGFRTGVQLDDGTRTSAADAVLIGPTDGGNNSWIEVKLHEGKNRQIHRSVEALGFQVAKLCRISYAGLGFGDLQPGEVRPLERQEIAALRRHAGLMSGEIKNAAPPPPRRRGFAAPSQAKSKPVRLPENRKPATAKPRYENVKQRRSTSDRDEHFAGSRGAHEGREPVAANPRYENGNRRSSTRDRDERAAKSPPSRSPQQARSSAPPTPRYENAKRNSSTGTRDENFTKPANKARPAYAPRGAAPAHSRHEKRGSSTGERDVKASKPRAPFSGRKPATRDFKRPRR